MDKNSLSKYLLLEESQSYRFGTTWRRGNLTSRKKYFFFLTETMVASSIVTNIVVSASDVMPTDRWLNIWCIWHTKSGNTSGVSKSSLDWLNYTGFPGDVRVAFFNVPPGNKDAVTPNPLTKEESHRVYNGDDKRLSGSNKRWIFKSMWNIKNSQHRIFQIRPRVLHTDIVPLLWRHCYCGDISTPRNVTLNKANCD